MREISLLTGRVAIGDNEATIAAVECVRIPDDLIQKTREANWEVFRTGSCHHQIRVGDVLLVVRAVEVVSIPARREHEFEANAISTVRIEELLVRKFMAIKSALGGSLIVQAVEAESALLKVALLRLTQGGPGRLLWVWLIGITKSILATVSVTSHHLEAFGESRDVVSEEQVVADFRSILHIRVVRPFHKLTQACLLLVGRARSRQTCLQNTQQDASKLRDLV